MPTKKSGGTRKHGRQKRKPTHQRYNLQDRRFKNKLKRVRRSSGEPAAVRYRRWHLRRVRAGD